MSAIFSEDRKRGDTNVKQYFMAMKLACFRKSKKLSSKDSDFNTLLPMIFQTLVQT